MAESPGWDLGGKKGVLVMARPYTHSSPNLFGDDKMTKTNTNTSTNTKMAMPYTHSSRMTMIKTKTKTKMARPYSQARPNLSYVWGGGTIFGETCLQKS